MNRGSASDRLDKYGVILFGFVLTTVGGAILVSHLQNRVFQKQQQERVFTEISDLMDARMYRMRQVLHVHREKASPPEMEARWNDYRELLFTWNAGLNKNLALTQRYFGADARRCFDRIHAEFRAIGGRLEAIKRGSASLGDTADVRMKLEALNVGFYRFDLALLESLSSWRIGKPAPEACPVQLSPGQSSDPSP